MFYSSSSSSSSSYAREWAEALINSYPTEEQFAEIIGENYFNHFTELSHEQPAVAAASQVTPENVKTDETKRIFSSYYYH